jgi:transcriptional regulator with XRE-family HTH domain/GTPase SAR1 family protein
MESSFGNQLKTLRSRVKQLKQIDVAKRLNVSFVSVSYWENDFNKPNMRNLKSLISLLFVEGAFTSAEEIERFWQATALPIDEVWLADLLKKETPDPKLSLACDQVILSPLENKPEDHLVDIKTNPPIGDDDSQVSVPMYTLPGLLPRVPAPPPGAPASQKEQLPVKTQAITASQSPPIPTSLRQNRLRLLQRVRSFWITGVFEQSLHGVALIPLGLQEQPDAVVNPWRLIIQESGQASPPLPAGTRVAEVYDAAGGELLILGEPGAGKTTLLLELARDLLSRAEQESSHPIPVVFNLSSWGRRKRRPLALWLLEELETKYHVPRSMGADWITANQILPLLDGLDEVDADSRAACIQAINDYREVHSFVPLVVCCRVDDYRSQANQLELARAVTIEPLTPEQITTSLARIGESRASLRIAFDRDPVLQELATTPLMLTLLIQVYQGASLEEIKGGVSAGAGKNQIFATYTQRMLRRRKAESRYAPEQTISWLSHLAYQMKHQGQTLFFLEQMQPSWLMKPWQRRFYYGLITGPICGLFVGLVALGTVLSFPLVVLITALVVGLFLGWVSELDIGEESTRAERIRRSVVLLLERGATLGVAAGLVVGMSSFLYLFIGDFSDWSLGSRIAGALASALPNGMCIGVCVGLTVRLERGIEPVEASGWSWAEMGRGITRWVFIGIGLIVEVMVMFPFLLSSHDASLANFLAFGLSSVFQSVLVVMLVSGVTRGLSMRVLGAQQVVTPNQGIWRSARYGVVMGLITAGIAAVLTGTTDFLAYYWFPLHLGSAIKPLGIDREAVNIMSHLLGFSPTTSQEFWMLHALFWGLTDAAIPALAVGLVCGGAAYVQHFVLRFLLWGAGYIPFNYAPFLDYATERILLRKVGGGYIFPHRLLLEYFADM